MRAEHRRFSIKLFFACTVTTLLSSVLAYASECELPTFDTIELEFLSVTVDGVKRTDALPEPLRSGTTGRLVANGTELLFEVDSDAAIGSELECGDVR